MHWCESARDRSRDNESLKQNALPQQLFFSSIFYFLRAAHEPVFASNERAQLIVGQCYCHGPHRSTTVLFGCSGGSSDPLIERSQSPIHFIKKRPLLQQSIVLNCDSSSRDVARRECMSSHSYVERMHSWCQERTQVQLSYYVKVNQVFPEHAYGPICLRLDCSQHVIVQELA